jgi:hypothetical protein
MKTGFSVYILVRLLIYLDRLRSQTAEFQAFSGFFSLFLCFSVFLFLCLVLFSFPPVSSVAIFSCDSAKHLACPVLCAWDLVLLESFGR